MVAPLSHDDQLIYRLRRQLEPEIAGRACKLLDDADLRRLENYVAMFGDESFDIDDIYQAHHAFHELLQPTSHTCTCSASCGTPPNHLDEAINERLPFVLDLTDVRGPAVIAADPMAHVVLVGWRALRFYAWALTRNQVWRTQESESTSLLTTVGVAHRRVPEGAAPHG